MENSNKFLVAIIVVLGIAISCMLIACVNIKKTEENILNNSLEVSNNNFELNKKYNEKNSD